MVSDTVTEIPEPLAPATSIQDELGETEAHLIRLTREAGEADRPVDEVIAELMELAGQIRRVLSHVQEALERRDLTYNEAARLQEMRRRALWLYRRSRLERVFHAKLRLERMLRDTLYRQVLETYDELSSMEAEETRLHDLSDENLLLELFREVQGPQGREASD